MNLPYVHRPCGTDEPKTLMLIGSFWPMNVCHVVLQPPWCHIGLMFVGSLMNITATWQTRPAKSTPRGSYVLRGTDKHKNFFKSCFACLPGRGASKTGIQYTNSSKHIYNIQQSNTSNITSIDPTPPRHIKIQTL
jgi:hypothetical protein